MPRAFSTQRTDVPRAHRCTPRIALGEEPGIFRVATLEDGFNAPEEHPAAPGGRNLPAFDFRLQPQVPLDAGHRVDGDPPSAGGGSVGVVVGVVSDDVLPAALPEPLPPRRLLVPPDGRRSDDILSFQRSVLFFAVVIWQIVWFTLITCLRYCSRRTVSWCPKIGSLQRCKDARPALGNW